MSSTVSTVSKWGNSLGVRIPRVMAEQMDISEGESVELIVANNHLLIQKAYPLEKLLEQVTPGNVHSEIDVGAPRGKEE
jgi:antitoxin MazE